jgi:hypothetical protein
MLVDCMVVPYPLLPGALHDSRTNIPAESPASFVIDQSTRRDVLFELGEPDGMAPDESWYSYGSAFAHIGRGLFFFVYGNPGAMGIMDWRSIEFRHLVVGFDDTGTVSSITFEKKNCTSRSVLRMQEGREASAPCLDIRSGASTESTPLDLGPFPVVKCRCSDSVVPRKSLLARPVFPGESPFRIGVLRIADGAVLFTAPPDRRRTYLERQDRIAIADLESVDMVPVWRSADLPHINLHTTDGRCIGLAFTDFNAPNVTIFLRERIGRRIRSRARPGPVNLG